MSVAASQMVDSPSRATESYWRRRVPKHWEVPSNFALFHERIDRGGSEDEMLTVTIDRGILRQSDFLEGSSKKDSSNEDKSNYKRVKVGDLAYNKMRMWQGAVGYSAYEGIVSPAYVVLQPRRPINPRYFHYLFRTPLYTHLSAQHSHGICDDQNSLRFEDFKRIFSPFPPRPEQDAIVAYLDGKLEAIDRYVRVKEREIALLEERKRGLINRAVTRGLDPNPQLQPSGIPWLPEIPVGWEAVQLRRVVTRVKTGGTPPGATEDQFATEDGFPWFTPGDFVDSDIIMRESSRSLSTIGSRHCIRFPDNSVMMVGIGATIGKIGVPRREASCNQQINAIIPGTKVRPDFLAYFLVTQRDFIISCGKYTTMPILNQDDTKSLYVFVPPLSEQDAIANFIAQEVIEIDTTITRARQQIERMQEYRTALIAEAVTGKISVLKIPAAG